MQEPNMVYHACHRCTAKFYSPVGLDSCPRCGACDLLEGPSEPPWQRPPTPPRESSEAAESCDHTPQAFNEQGGLVGSWRIDDSQRPPRVVCSQCGKFYGYLRDDRRLQERLEAAYRQQQQRLSCPGCGEEPFVG
ncbi:MAG: hypothetical protein KF688_01205 [Pirellulales bacterium]|nr:hypothetical protein [Pirellulales bacterium]